MTPTITPVVTLWFRARGHRQPWVALHNGTAAQCAAAETAAMKAGRSGDWYTGTANPNVRNQACSK